MPSPHSSSAPITLLSGSLLKLILIIFTHSILPAQSQQRDIGDLKTAIREYSDSLKKQDSNDNYVRPALKFSKELEAASENFDPDQLKLLNGNLRNLNFGAYHETLYTFLQEISTLHTKKNEQALQNWSKQIDIFIAKVKKSCTDDAPALELESLKIEVAGLKLKRPPNIDPSSHWAKSETVKLTSVTVLLNRWLGYYEVKEKGDWDYSRSKLEYFKNAPGVYPILDRGFLDLKIATILQARGIKEKTRIEYIKGIKTQITVIRPLIILPANTPLGKKQLQVIKNLEEGNWDSKTTLEYSKNLETLLDEQESSSIWQREINRSIKDLASCLISIKSDKYSLARIQLETSNWGKTSAPWLQLLERKVILTLIPVLYPELNPPPLKKGQPTSRYLFELISKPRSIEKSATEYYPIVLYHRKHWYKMAPKYKSYRPKWQSAAFKQNSYISKAQTAMAADDHLLALSYFHSAFYYALKSGPVTAQFFIEEQIKKIRESHPELDEISTAYNSKQLDLLEKELTALDADLKNLMQK